MSEIKENEQLREQLEEHYKKLVMERQCGMRSTLAWLENLRAEMDAKSETSSFERIYYRIKTFDSAYEKLPRKGMPLTKESLSSLHDIAGIRIIVPYLDDLYKVRNYIVRPAKLTEKVFGASNLVAKNQPSLKIDKERNYVDKRKPSGYRALHLLCRMKVDFVEDHSTVWVPVEIQIMTSAMEFWANKEHELRYKNSNPSPEADNLLEEMSDQLSIVEEQLMKLRDYRAKEDIKQPAEAKPEEATEPDDDELEMITLDDTIKATVADQ